MKTTFTSHEIAHIWAHKSAPYGKSPGAVSFDGPVIRSYQTAMARHIEHKGKPAIIYNATSYSVSTSKHQGRIWQAIPHNDPALTVFRVDGQPMGADLRLSGEDLFKHYIERAALSEQSANTERRIKQTTRDGFHAQASRYLEQAKAVSDFFGLRKKVDEKTIERLATAKARAERRERIAREAREMREKIDQQLAYDHWLHNEPHNYFNARLFPVAFRVEGDELVSTLGARVPLRAAMVAYRFAMAHRAIPWREKGEAYPDNYNYCPVGNYRLNAINAQGIVAGCHRISWAELERLAPVLSGETVNA